MTVIAKYHSTILLQAELAKRNYTFENFDLCGSAYTRFIAPSGQSWLTQDASIGYPFTSVAIQKISVQKQIAHELAEHIGVTTPFTTQVVGRMHEDEMRELLKAAPLVVKPSNSSLSNGVTLQVRTLPMLETALAVAHAFSEIALVQSQVEGDEVRFVLLDGKVQATLLRQTARVVGDGIHTVQELLDAENSSRAELDMPYLQYPQLDASIIDFDAIDMAEILQHDEVLELSRGTMVKSGASIYNVFDQMHPSYVATAEKLGTAVGARFIVVDIIIRDYTQPQTDDNYSFIEFNTGPVLKLFYSCRDGKHYDVLESLASMIDQTLEGNHA